MSKPSVLSPWFVVMKIEDDGTISGDYKAPSFYTEVEEGEEMWDTDPSKARLFNSIHSASRVARAGGAYCVAVTDEDGLKEFRPNGL